MAKRKKQKRRPSRRTLSERFSRIEETLAHQLSRHEAYREDLRGQLQVAIKQRDDALRIITDDANLIQMERRMQELLSRLLEHYECLKRLEQLGRLQQ